MAQSMVKGKVTDERDGSPMPGVTIRLKGSSIVAVSNGSGDYSITAKAGQIMVFTFIGYVTKEVTVGTSAGYNVKLQESAGTLNEVVVTAYGIPRDKKSLGYSTPIVKGDEVSETQREDFFGGLQGRVPGLSINSTNGAPGASAQIVLRGFTSISGDNNALIVVDGVPINNTTLNQNNLVTNGANSAQDYSNRAMDINPYDIETYTIMKGPEATALYGSAGSGGAILITTKKGKAGAGSVTYTNSFRESVVNKFPEIQQVYNSGTTGGVFSSSTSSFFGPKFVAGTQIYDNIHNFYQHGYAQKHNVALQGGTDKFTYYWSNEYSDTKGTIPTTTYTRFSSRLTGSAVISPLLKVTTTMNYVNTNNNKTNKANNGTLEELMRFPSDYDITNYQDANGNRVLHLASIYSEYDNPLWDVNKDPSYDKGDRFIGNVNLLLTPNNWFSINGIFGTDVAATNGTQVYNGQSYKGSGSATAPTLGSILNYQDLTKIYNGSVVATAKTKMGKSFSGTYIAGATFSDFTDNVNSQYGTHFGDPNFYSINNTLVTTRNAATTLTRYRSVGTFVQAVLGYKSLVYVTLTERVDGSSKLSASYNANTGSTAVSYPFFSYPAASMAFNFTELKQVQNALPFVNYGKLRVSYAETGKEPGKPYLKGTVYTAASTTGGGYAVGLNGGNSDLSPERTKNFETGIELQFLNNRLGLDFNYYTLRSEGQIILPRLSYISGFVLEYLNGGIVRHNGVEVQITANPIKSAKFNWNTILNFSHDKGTVVSIANQLPELYDSDTQIVGTIRSAVAPGYSIGTITGPRFDKNNAGQTLINPSTGLPTISDVNYYPIGDRTPKFNASLNNTFSYKSVSLSFLWDLRYGGDVVNGTEYEAYTKGISVKTLDREVPRIITGVLNDGFQNTNHPTPNNIAIIPYSNSSYYTTNVSPEMFVEHNIKTLRLRDVTLRYNFPQSTLARLGFVKSLGVFFTVTDAILITNYSGMDPESNATNASSGGIGGYGIDYGNVGKPISYNIGLSVKL
ncbi:SusC/RagA family TonB-linked outer membrane protein [Mucilaginibacter gracilis]|nr:SusC/RagA family TonB-linked outer membrane protein [Mucilaginibacter gracilis]